MKQLDRTLKRVFVPLLVGVAGIAAVVGCGGGGGGSRAVVGSASVSITTSGLSPRSFSLLMGSTVTWTNNTSHMVKIVSGQIVEVAHREVRTPPPLIPTLQEFTIGEDGSFSPASKELDYGWYEVGWLNLSGRSVALQILDESGEQIASKRVANGAVASYYFGHAGAYTFHLSGAPTVTGTVVLSGTPCPDGKFESPYLKPGQTYSTVVNAAGFQDYYVVDQDAPNTSHTCGWIVEKL